MLRKRPRQPIFQSEFVQHLPEGINILIALDHLHEADEEFPFHSGDLQDQVSIHHAHIRFYILRDFAPVHLACVIYQKSAVFSVFSGGRIMLLNILALVLEACDIVNLIVQLEQLPNLRMTISLTCSFFDFWLSHRG